MRAIKLSRGLEGYGVGVGGGLNQGSNPFPDPNPCPTLISTTWECYFLWQKGGGYAGAGGPKGAIPR